MILPELSYRLMTYVPTDDGYGVFLLLAFSLQIFKSVGTCATSTSSFVLLAEEFDNIATVFVSTRLHKEHFCRLNLFHKDADAF